jgi:arylsulfatase A-like enzyme|tara:strand:- start:8986 stop:9186 length:201 start_codon:yes stop_codon:yes gene_type:complete
MIREGDWKYIHFPKFRGADELYHLASDPHEMHNRIEDPNAAQLVKKLKRRIDSEIGIFSKARSNDY